MFFKEFTFLVILWTTEILTVTVEPQYAYPFNIENVAEYIAPSTRKVVSKRPQKQVPSNQEDIENLKYLLVLKPRPQYHPSEPETLDNNGNESNGNPREAIHQVRAPQLYLPRYVPEQTAPEVPRQHAVIPLKNKSRINVPQNNQAISNHRPDDHLTKGAAAINLEQLIRKGQAIQEIENNSKIIYQAHGFAGPKTYKFGYDTGRGKNQQFHEEESVIPGHIKGQYGYVNPRGRPTVVKYVASPESGFRIEKVL